jgi:FtsZ-interacting cell division protein ZipA
MEMGHCKTLIIALCIYLIIDIFWTRKRKIANKFKDMNIEVAYKTTDTIQEYVQLQEHNNNEYDNSDVYRLIYMDT